MQCLHFASFNIILQFEQRTWNFYTASVNCLHRKFALKIFFAKIIASLWKIFGTSAAWAVPSSVKFEVCGLVKSLSLILEDDNVEEVWSQRSLKLKNLLNKKKFEVEEVLDGEVGNWRNLKLKKFEVGEV